MILFGRNILIALSAGNLLVASSGLPAVVDSASVRHQRSDSTNTHPSTIRGIVTGAAVGAAAGFAASLLIKFDCQPAQIGSGGQQGTCNNSIEHRANVVITVSGATLGAIIGGVMAHRRWH